MTPPDDSGSLVDHRGRFDSGVLGHADGGDHPVRARVVGALVGMHWAAGLLLWILVTSLELGAWSRLTWPDVLVMLPIGAATGAVGARPRARARGTGTPAIPVARAGVLAAVAVVGVTVALPREPALAWGALLAGVAIPLLAGALAVAVDRSGLVRRVAGAAVVAGTASLVLWLGWLSTGPGIGFAMSPRRAFLVLAALVMVVAPAVAARAAGELAPVPVRRRNAQAEPHARRHRAWTLAGALLGLAWAIVLRLGMSGLVIADGGLTSFDWNLTTTAILVPAVVTGAGWGWAAHARRHGSAASPRWGSITALAFLLVPLATVDGIVGLLASGEGVQLWLVPVLLVVGGLAMSARRRWPRLLVGALLVVGAVALLGQGSGAWPAPSAVMVANTVSLVGGFGIAFVAGAEPFRTVLVAPLAVPTLTTASPPVVRA
ncbi:MAG TPA: hypothetical protein VJ978_05625 [Nitriliruptoraceae bacterium]|nr:hypothetical protein [Nitriliruptoraceae bacterium]